MRARLIVRPDSAANIGKALVWTVAPHNDVGKVNRSVKITFSHGDRNREQLHISQREVGLVDIREPADPYDLHLPCVEELLPLLPGDSGDIFGGDSKTPMNIVCQCLAK